MFIIASLCGITLFAFTFQFLSRDDVVSIHPGNYFIFFVFVFCWTRFNFSEDSVKIIQVWAQFLYCSNYTSCDAIDFIIFVQMLDQCHSLWSRLLIASMQLLVLFLIIFCIVMELNLLLPVLALLVRPYQAYSFFRRNKHIIYIVPISCLLLLWWFRLDL
jgi:hypothetical protein